MTDESTVIINRLLDIIDKLIAENRELRSQLPLRNYPYITWTDSGGKDYPHKYTWSTPIVTCETGDGE